MGDRVVALVDHQQISKGDVGTVAGPCDVDVSDKADRMVVNFEGKGRAISLKSQVEHAKVASAERRGASNTLAPVSGPRALGAARAAGWGSAMAGEACFVDPTPYQVRVGCVRMCVLRARMHSARARSSTGVCHPE